MKVRVKSLVRNVVEKSDGTPHPFIGLEDVESGTGRLATDDLPEKAAEDSIVHRPGDVLFSKLRPYLAKSYLPKWPGTATGELLVLRPSERVDTRFLFYVTLSQPWINWANTTSYGSKMPRTSWEYLADYRVWLPPRDEQRRIADFLDAETARIEALKDSTVRQRELIAERREAALHTVILHEGGPDLSVLDTWSTSEDWSVVPLNRVLTQLTNGYVGPTRDLLVESGVPYIQSLHLKDGHIDFERKPYYVTQAWVQERPRIRLRIGDVLIVQTGAIGEVAIVDQEFAGASCHALLIARADPQLLQPQYLWHLFRSSWGRNVLFREQTGALHPHLEAGHIKYIRVPISSLSVQRRVMAHTEELLRDAGKVDGLLLRRLQLQRERRAALITAAVTGQFDVSSASGRGVTE